MQIRHSEERDLSRILEIYSHARAFMAEHGNPNQWGRTNWPPKELIRQDIREGHSYVCEWERKVVGTFYYNYGLNIAPTYEVIRDGAWLAEGPFGVVHRLAGDGSVKGIGRRCLSWAFEQCGHLRIDTHSDNLVMQNLLQSLGFQHCGTIFVREDCEPRLAYEKIETRS